MADEFDIYGDAFDKRDDILDEIVGTQREAKRQRAMAYADDDLFDDLGDIVKDVKPAVPHETKGKDLQKIKSSVPGYTPKSTDAQTKRESPTALNSLRGLVTHPTCGMYIGELAWYTTDRDIKTPLIQGGFSADLKELTFFEHKVNGKSKGIVYLEFTSADIALQAKQMLDQADFHGKKAVTSFTIAPNPFKHFPKEPVKSRTPPRPTPPTTFGFGFNGGGFTNPGMPYGYPMINNNNNNNYMGRTMRPGQFNRNRPTYMETPGYQGMYINPAFFDQQNQGNHGY
ncbi:hypothetical protein BDF14DRAFT_1800659 [Spinellus fusiger]|nr:hypothetical protein BDF14DRAFT_1800659 [Spinellus fusiger]